MTSIADLEIFARVVTAGSMSAAGRELDLSPAVISKRISHLETRLGTRLFHRTTRQLQMTETGRGFYERVVNILATVQEAEAFVSSGNKMPGGALKITAPTGFSRLHIAPYLGRFVKAYPDLNVEVVATDQLVDIVRDGIDVAIRVAELDDSSLVARRLAPCRRFFCASPEYLAEAGEPRSLSELSSHRILVENNTVWKLAGPEGVVSLKMAAAIKTNSSEVVQQAALAGCGIAVRSTWQVREELLAKRLIPILPEYSEAPGIAIYAVYACKQYIPAKLRVFVDFLASIYGSEPYWDKDLDIIHKPKKRLAKQVSHIEAAI